jgi:polyisoprenoid-binding protein YceI
MRTPWLLTSLLVAVCATPNESGALGHPILPESRVWITGASNLRRFSCEAGRVRGVLALRANTTPTTVLSGENASIEPSLSVPVNRFDCGIGAMNRHFRETLHGAAHPVIEFRLATYEVELGTPAPTAHLTGELMIAGVRRPVTVSAALRADSSGALHVQGTYVVRMTDFGVQPPRRFGGLLRVHDRVTVHFDVAPGSDGGALDGLCSLIPPATTKPTSGATYVLEP